MAIILLIDTSADESLIALSKDGVICAMQRGGTMQQQAATINTSVAQVLEDSGCTFQSLHAVAVCAGPGSYTGLRIGMATAKGLCYALDIKLLSVNKLALLATQAHALQAGQFAHYVAIIKARDNEYFISGFDAGLHNNLPPQLMLGEPLKNTLQELESVCCITDVQEIIKEHSGNPEKCLFLSGKIDENQWAKQAESSYICQKYDSIFSAAPIYMKNVYFHNNK